MRRSTKHRLKQRALYLGVVALCALLAVWLATWGEAADTRRYMAAPAPADVCSGIANLVLFYKFDNNGNDSSGNARNCTPTAGFTFSTTNPAVGTHNAEGDGVGGRCDLDGFSMPATGTASLWLRSNFDESGALGSDYTPLGDGTGSGTGWRLRFQGSQNRWIVYTAGSSRIVQGAEPADLTGWHHYVVTWSATGSELIRDNVSIGTGAGDDSHTGTETGVRVGSRYHVSAPSEYWDGAMDQYCIYDRVLNASEITQLFNEGPTPGS